MVITKNFPNSFQKLLTWKVAKQNIKELLICGMMTHMCIDATTKLDLRDLIVLYLMMLVIYKKDLEFNKNKIMAQDDHDSFMASLKWYFCKGFKYRRDFQIC